MGETGRPLLHTHCVTLEYSHPEFIETNSNHLLNCSLISTPFIPIKSAPFHADKVL